MAATTCISGPPCVPGKTDRSMARASSCLPKISPPRAPRRVLCVVVVTMSAWGTGLGCCPAATRPAMWAMSTISIASTPRAMARHPLEVDDARVGAGAGHDELGPDLPGLTLEGVVVDAPVGLRHPVGVEVEVAAAEVDGVAVGQVTAVRQAHAQDGVAMVEHREVGRHVGLRTRVGLDVAQPRHPGTVPGRGPPPAAPRRPRTRSRRSSACPGWPSAYLLVSQDPVASITAAKCSSRWR